MGDEAGHKEQARICPDVNGYPLRVIVWDDKRPTNVDAWSGRGDDFVENHLMVNPRQFVRRVQWGQRRGAARPSLRVVQGAPVESDRYCGRSTNGVNSDIVSDLFPSRQVGRGIVEPLVVPVGVWVEAIS